MQAAAALIPAARIRAARRPDKPAIAKRLQDLASGNLSGERVLDRYCAQRDRPTSRRRYR